MGKAKGYLIRYWIRFSVDRTQHQPDYGVTAFSREDAFSLLSDFVFSDPSAPRGQTVSLPPVEKLIENVDVSTLDKNHVIPNMGDCSIRGIWWPPLRYTS